MSQAPPPSDVQRNKRKYGSATNRRRNTSRRRATQMLMAGTRVRDAAQREAGTVWPRIASLQERGPPLDRTTECVGGSWVIRGLLQGAPGKGVLSLCKEANSMHSMNPIDPPNSRNPTKFGLRTTYHEPTFINSTNSTRPTNPRTALSSLSPFSLLLEFVEGRVRIGYTVSKEGGG